MFIYVDYVGSVEAGAAAYFLFVIDLMPPIDGEVYCLPSAGFSVRLMNRCITRSVQCRGLAGLLHAECFESLPNVLLHEALTNGSGHPWTE